MGKTFKFIALSVLIILGRIFDAYTTSVYTPDLKHEGNPIVHYLGSGWFGVIIVQIIVTALVIYGLYYYLFRFIMIKPNEGNLTWKEYVSFFCFYDKHSFHKLLYKPWNNKPGLMAAFGYVTTMTLIFASYLVGISTTFLIISPSYKHLYHKGGPYVLLSVSVLAMLYFSRRFFRRQYQKYRMLAATPPLIVGKV